MRSAAQFGGEAPRGIPAECPLPVSPSLGEIGAEALLGAVGSLPCVNTVAQSITTLNIDSVTELLEKAAYFSLRMSARPAQGDVSAGTAVFQGESHRFVLATEQTADGRIVARNTMGASAAQLTCTWRLLPDDHEGGPGVPSPERVVWDPKVSQRFELSEFVLRFADGAGSGLKAYGTGSTLPGSGSSPQSTGLGAAADVLEGWGQLRGLAGSIVVTGDLLPSGELSMDLMIRMMDPQGGLLTQSPLPPIRQPLPEDPGVTCLTFLGQVDPKNPVTLRFSLSEGLLGSKVFEDLRVAQLNFDVVDGGHLLSRATTGPIAGTVQALLDFNPLSLAPISPVRTQNGIFEFYFPDGRRLGSFFADMTEGRSFRTSLEGMLLPVFRFAGFGPVCGGTGEFAGARGIMTLNAVISVQPRTLSNLYTIRLNDPDGRYRALFGRAAR